MSLTTLQPGGEAPPGPPPGPGPFATGRRSPRPGTGARRPGTEATAEIALVGVTLTAVLGFGRLFADWSFLAPAAGAALAAHAVAFGCRRAGLGGLAASVASGIGLVLYVAWVLEPGTTVLGLPGPDTWAVVTNQLSAAWRQFSTVVAPTPTTAGFTLAAALGGWWAAWLGDLFAFRARVRTEAMIPSFTLLLFAAMLGADRYRVPLAVAYLAAVLAFAVTSGPTGIAPGYAWFGVPRPGSGTGARRGGAIVGLVAVAAGLVVGPKLPGAASDALVSWRDQEKDHSSRIAVSPLVDIRGRLVDQSGTEVFTVESPASSYWRLTSLDRFDGTIWSSRGNYQRARGELPAGVATEGQESLLRQQFTISALSTIWLPAAFRPERLVGRVGGLRYDRDTASLLTDQPTADGLSYTIESSLPELRATDLAAVAGSVPDSVAARYLELPASFPASVANQARRVVDEAGAGRPYEMARALQDWFRSSFTYSLDVPAGHGNGAIEQFLARRTGYCEQFAGTYAAMARSLGLPARVAVGFTAGTRDAAGRFHVAGRNAHAWPEVYVAGYGWVAFEPTPGRGQPGAEDYTGVAPVDDAGGGGQPSASPAPPSPSSPQAAPSQPVPTTAPPGAMPGDGPPPADDASSGTGSADRSAGWLWMLGACAVVAGGATAGIPAAKRLVRLRRRAAAATPAEQVLAAWEEADSDLGVLGLSRFPTETLEEHASRAAAASNALRFAPVLTLAKQASTALTGLATEATAATWSPSGVPDDAADRAWSAAAAVAGGMRGMASRRERVLWALDPRPLVKVATGCLPAGRRSRR